MALYTQHPTYKITQVGHTFAVGNLIYHNGTIFALASAVDASLAEVAGMVVDVTSGEFTIAVGGVISGLTGIVPGAVYFLSASSPGAYTTTEPTTPGQISKPIMLGINTTDCIFTNQRGFVLN